VPKPVEKSLSEGLDATKESTEEEKLRAQSKKEMYANAWQNSGAGHITEAVKSIRRGIKNIRTKNKAKKAEKLTSAKEAVGSGTETLKQAKTVERNRKKTDKLALNKIKSDAKDKKKLAEYRKKNPVRGKEAINLLANQTKKL
jgi:pyridoxal biosynthesis lyase PdxS